MPLYPPAGGAGGAAISAGTQSQNTGTVVFSNSNGISFGLNNGTLTATVTPGAAAGVAAAAAGTQTQTSGTLVFANSNGATFGMSGSSQVTMDFGSSRLAGTGFTSTTIAGIAPAATLNTAGLSMAFPNVLTTARASNDGVGLATAQTNVTWTVNSAGISVNAAGYAGTGFTSTTTAGVDVKATHNTAGLSMAMPSFLTTAAQSNHSHGNPQLNLTNLTGTTASNSAGFTLSLSGNAAQTNQSAIRGLGVSNTGVTAGNTGISTGIDWVLAGSQSLTLSQSTAGGGPNTIWFQHPAWLTTQSVQTQASGNIAGTGTTFNGANISGSMTMNSVGLQLSMSVAAPGGGGNTVTLYANSNTTQSSSGTANISSINFAGAGIASVGVTNGSVVISVPAGGGAGDGGNIVSMLTSTSGGGTAGATFSNSTASIGLMAGSNITLSQTSNTIVFNAPDSSSLVVGNGLSISTTGSTISIYANPLTLSYFNPQDAYVQVAGQQGQASLHIQPMQAPNVQFDKLCMPIINTNSSNSSGSHTLSFWVGIYTRNASTLSLASSTSATTAVTHSGTAGSYSQYSGVRLFTIASTGTLLEGQYWLGILSRTTSGGTNGSYSQVLCSQQNSSYFGLFGAATNATQQLTRGLGVYTVTTAGMPNSIAFSQINGNSSVFLRQPILYFVSGTV